MTREMRQRAYHRDPRGMAAELVPAVPAEAPEVGDRGGLSKGTQYGPVRDGLPQEQAAYERRDVVHRIDGRIHDHAAVEKGERRRDPVEVWIEEHLAGPESEKKTRPAGQDKL